MSNIEGGIISLNEISMPDVPLRLTMKSLTPTGGRTVTVEADGYSRYVDKGRFTSPVHTFGFRAEDHQRRWMYKFRAEGAYGGRATEDDVVRELEVWNQLSDTYPGLEEELYLPIWKLTEIIPTEEEIQIWRETDQKPRQGYIIRRKFPFTEWRVADAFIASSNYIESQLDRLQSIWNVSSREGVYLRSIKRLGKALGYLYGADVVHGNLYWLWYDNRLSRVYARPNPHNIALDGSVGDFETIDDLYCDNEGDVFVREALGAFSTYSLLIAKQNPELLEDAAFISNFIEKFYRCLPGRLRHAIDHTKEARRMLVDYNTRLILSQDGVQTFSRLDTNMECFEDEFFARRGYLVVSLLDKLVNS